MGGGGYYIVAFPSGGKTTILQVFRGKKATMGGGTAIQHRYNDFISLNLHFSQSRYISIMRKTITINNLRFSDFVYSPAGVLYI